MTFTRRKILASIGIFVLGAVIGKKALGSNLQNSVDNDCRLDRMPTWRGN
jgi:hypothetical protein